ncbi:GMC oxidoreductase [Mycena venus]|uniref:GMC oxidoreductase n=1 Tax=Mycena venus TaxID=2733690 RepID=A0A8H6XXM9_9AGAR|nr:GMC oxidoreductase [Mycena venus]
MQFYASQASEHVGGRSVVVPSGRCIGGGSSVNFMLYNRPAASDFDAWEKDYGNVGWSAKDLIPMLQKGQIGKEFIELGPKFEKDRPKTDEANALNVESINAFHAMPKWISSDGRRSDVAHHYIYQKHIANLSVFDGCLVNRVVIENGVAVGVEYLFDKRIYESSPQDTRIVKARKLVIVSGGAMGSPLILERSGIGRKDVLQRAGIPVVVEIPGVGENYQDHALIITPSLMDPAVESLNPLFRGDPETWAKALEQWEEDGSGLLGNNGFDGGYPESRGHVHIESSDPYAAPNFLAGFLSSPIDVAALRWAYKKGRELTRRLPSFRGAFDMGHPQFSHDSPAALKDTAPVSLEAANIVYTAEDDLAIDTYMRQNVETAWHSLGTCAMKPFDQGGVVDSQLNVYGVKNLKVADVSIPPSNVNSNTYSTAIAIGEKAAAIIAHELGGCL